MIPIGNNPLPLDVSLIKRSFHFPSNMKDFVPVTKAMTTIFTLTTRLGGLAALALGAAYFLQYDIPLHIHMAVGCLVVLALWGLAILARTARTGLAVTAALWGAILPVVGVLQLFLPVYLQSEDAQWILQILHVAMAVGAIVLAEVLAKSLKTA